MEKKVPTVSGSDRLQAEIDVDLATMSLENKLLFNINECCK